MVGFRRPWPRSYGLRTGPLRPLQPEVAAGNPDVSASPRRLVHRQNSKSTIEQAVAHFVLSPILIFLKRWTFNGALRSHHVAEGVLVASEEHHSNSTNSHSGSDVGTGLFPAWPPDGGTTFPSRTSTRTGTDDESIPQREARSEHPIQPQPQEDQPGLSSLAQAHPLDKLEATEFLRSSGSCVGSIAPGVRELSWTSFMTEFARPSSY